MAKRTTLQLWTGSGWEDLFPKTRSDMVILGNGENNLEHRLNMVEAVARGAQQSLSFENYQEAIEYLNNLPYMQLSIGQNIYIRTLDVPDFWVFNTIDIPYNYTYTNDQDFITYITSKWGGQVGYYILSPLEGSKSVITNDASSQVLAGGVHQSVWNADTKLDKRTDTYTRRRAYLVDTNGTQLMLGVGYSNDAISQTLAVRDTYGSLYVPTSSIGKTYNFESGEEAVNRNYVDKGFLAKTTVTSEMLLTQKVNGSTDKLGFDTAAKPYYIVRRDANGDVLVNDTPSSTSAAVNQKYVDNAVANAGGGSGGGLYKHTLYWETEDGEEVQLELFTTRSTRYSLIEDDTSPWIQMFSETISARIFLGGFADEFSAVVSLYATEGDSDDPEYAMLVGLNAYYYYYSSRQLLKVSNIMGQSSFSYTVSKA